MSEFQFILSKAKENLASGKAFVLYRKPMSGTIYGLFQATSDVYEVLDFTEEGYVFAPFSEGKTLLIPYASSERMEAKWERGEAPLSKVPVLEEATQKYRHIDLVEKGISLTKDGTLEKVVLSRKQEMQLSQPDFTLSFRRLLDAYPEAFAYAFYSPVSGLWMGAFSEQLVHISGKELTTMALAGTRLADSQAEWGAKEKQEQQYVTDAIVEGLSSFTETIEKGSMQTIRAGRLEHIRTVIRADMKENTDLKALIFALHPTPAVCGRPKNEARNFILENEAYDREYYSGFHGELNIDGQTDLFVNLRCMKIEGDVATLFVGGGITEDSDPEKEWEETVNKAGTMGSIL